MRKGKGTTPRPARRGEGASVGSLRLLLSRQDDALDDEEQADHGRDGDLGPPGVGEAGGGDDVLDDAEREHAEERARDVADAAREHRAADDGGRDGVHLHAVRVGDGARGGVQDVDVSRDAREKPADDVGEEQRALGVDAEHQRALAVAAEGVEAAAEARPAQHNEGQHHEDERHGHADLHVGGREVAGVVHRPEERDVDARVLEGEERLVLHVEGLGVDDRGQAAGEEHAGERDDEGLYLEVGHEEALHQPEGQPDAERDEQRGDGVAAHVVEVHGAAHGHEAHDAADGDVDAAADHDQREADRRDDQRRVGVEDVEERLPPEESPAQERHGERVHEDEHDDGDREQQVGVGDGALGGTLAALGGLAQSCHLTLPPPLRPAWGCGCDATARRAWHGRSGRSAPRAR